MKDRDPIVHPQSDPRTASAHIGCRIRPVVYPGEGGLGGFQRVGAEPPPSRSPEAYQSLKYTDYDSSPRPSERTLCVVLPY
ncbi:MAG: hypothetical protein QM724_03635 [Flavobacteriales bacterium]